MNDKVKIEFDEETRRLIKLGCKELNMTPEQLIEEALKHLAKTYGVKLPEKKP